MKRLTKITLLLSLILLLTACAELLGHEEEAAEVQTLSVDDWPQQVQATPIPTPTSFPKAAQAAVEEPPADTTTTTQPSTPAESTTVGATMPTADEVGLPPSALRAISEQLDITELFDLLRQAEAGATPAELLAQIDSADLEVIISQIDPAEMQAMMASLDEEEATAVRNLLADNIEVAQIAGNDLDSALAILSQTEASEIRARITAAASNTLPLRATATLQGENIPLRTRPNNSAPTIDLLTGGDVAGIFGVDSTKQWAYSLTASDNGWIPLDSLIVVGTLDNIPTLPDTAFVGIGAQQGVLGRLNEPSSGPSAVEPPSETATTTTPASDTQVSTTADSAPSTASTTAAPNVANMATVTTVNPLYNVLNMRQGPGANYDLLQALDGTAELNVLAQNLTEDWLLVETETGDLGWVSKGLTDAEGAADSAPVVSSALPTTDIPAGQIAPISGLSLPTTSQPSSTDATAADDVTSDEMMDGSATEASATAASQTDNGLPAPADLTPMATLRINQPKVFLRLGPSTEFGYIDELTADDEDFQVLRVDPSRQWALVNRTFFEEPKIGWVALSDMTVTDGDVSEVAPAITSWTEGNRIETRTGPGITYDTLGYIGNNTLLILQGRNETGNWWFVTPANGAAGQFWVAERFVANLGSLRESVPVVNLPATLQPDAEVLALRQVRNEPQGTIVLQKSSGGDIMVINADGTGLRTLTQGIDPVLSPDGQTVAFTRWQFESIGSLWTINLNGTQERQIIDFTTKPKGATWSPDGSQIALNYQVSYEADRSECIPLTSNAFSKVPREARELETEIEDGLPVLCYDLPPQDYWNLRVVDVATGQFVDKDGGRSPFRPTWDPADPNRIVFDSGIGLAALDVEANSGRPLTDIREDGSPVFSPDGQFIATTTGQSNGAVDIYRLDRNGGSRAQLTKTPLWVTTGPEAVRGWRNVAPAWSPDGSLIAFLTDRAGDWQLWVMNADGSDQRPLFSDEINQQLDIEYNFVDERVLSWR